MSKQSDTVLVTTHYMGEAELRQQVGLISQGRHTPERLKQSQMRGLVLEIGVSETDRADVGGRVYHNDSGVGYFRVGATLAVALLPPNVLIPNQVKICRAEAGRDKPLPLQETASPLGVPDVYLKLLIPFILFIPVKVFLIPNYPGSLDTYQKCDKI